MRRRFQSNRGAHAGAGQHRSRCGLLWVERLRWPARFGSEPGAGRTHPRRWRTKIAALTAALAALLFTPHALQAQTFNTTYSFGGSCNAGSGGTDGSHPLGSGLIADSSGNLYGATSCGGTYGQGTVFELVKASGGYTEQILYSFGAVSGDGNEPQSTPVMDSAGDLFGTTEYGGASKVGTVYELVKSSSGYTEEVLHSFSFGGDALDPNTGANLIIDASGNLYGTTMGGGPNQHGAVFELTKTSSGYSEQVIYSFSPPGNGGVNADGFQPMAGVVMDSSGNLYGTTEYGGANANGTVYELIPSVTGYSEKTLYSFGAAGLGDGTFSEASLLLDPSGNLYGTTVQGGANNRGSVFELIKGATGYSEQLIYSFSAVTYIGNFIFLNNDGANPRAGLVMDNAGNLYGTAMQGGAYGSGTIFELVESSSGYTEVTLHAFSAYNSANDTNYDGFYPQDSLYLDTFGDLFGTAQDGGATGNGTTFEFIPQIVVPDVVGVPQGTAESEITGAQLTVGTITNQTSPTIATGDVISQSPAAGTAVAAGTPVNLVVSTGVGQATSLAIAFSPATATAGATDTVTATIASAVSTVGGTVTFTSDFNNTLTTICSQAAVMNVGGHWQATCAFNPGGAGIYVIDASYSGDAVNAASSNSASLTVSQGITPTLTPLSGTGNAIAINANNSAGLTYNAVLNQDSSVSILQNGSILSGQGCPAFAASGSSLSVTSGVVYIDFTNSRIYLAMLAGNTLYAAYEAIDPQGNCTQGPLLQVSTTAQSNLDMAVDPVQGKMYILNSFGANPDTLYILPTAPWSASSLPAPAQVTADYSATYGPMVIDASNHQVYFNDLGMSAYGNAGTYATSGFFVYDPNHSQTAANNLQHVVGYIGNGTTAALNVSTLLDNGLGKLVLLNENPSVNTTNLTTPITILDTTQFSFFTNTQPGTASNTVNIAPGGGLSTIAAVTPYGAISAADIDIGHSLVYAYAFSSNNLSHAQAGLLLEYNLSPGANPVETVLNSSMAMPQMYAYQGPWTRLNYDPKSTEIALSVDQNGPGGALGVTTPLCSGSPALSQLIGSQGAPSPVSFPVVNDASGYIYAINGGSSFPAEPAGIDFIAPPAGCSPANPITPTVDVAVNGATTFPTGTSISATVKVTGGTGEPTPTGTVSLSGGGYGPVTMTLTNGSANFSIPAWTLAAGNSITLTAAYTPDTNSTSTYTAATGTSPALVVETSTPAVTVQPASASIGTLQSLSVTITVGAGAGSPTAAGTVILTSTNSSNGIINYTSPVTTLSNGSATIDIPAGALTAGSDTLTAAYTPAGSSLSFYTSAAGSTTSPVIVSAPAAIQVNDPELVTATDTPQVEVGAVSDPENVTVTDIAVVTVSRLYTIGGALSGLANGESITLLDNGGDALTVGANGSFAFATGLISGSSYLVTVGRQPAGQSCVVNNGSGTVLAANVSSVSVTCKTDTATTLTISPSPSSSGQPVTFTGKVVPQAGNGTPGGTVTFACPNYAPGQSVNSGPISVNGGVAVWTTSALPAFTYPSCFTAAYSGDANYLPSASSDESLTVTDFQFDVPPPPLLILLPGQSTTFTFKVGSAFGPFIGTIDFVITGLPPNVTATFNPQTVTLGSNPVTVTVTLTAAQVAKLRQSGSGPGRALPLALALLFPILWPLLALGRAGRRLRRGGSHLLLVLLSVAVVFGISACGGNGFFNQPPQTYTATITAKSGTAQHSLTLKVTVE